MELILAHGIGGRADLPISLSLAQYGAAGILIATFVTIALLWKKPKFQTSAEGFGIAVPGIQRVIDSSIANVLLRAVGVCALMATLGIAIFGDDKSSVNPTPTWLYVWLWVGLIPASILFGAIWHRIDPLATITAGLRSVYDRGPKTYPTDWGRWPGAIGLAVFGWLELIAPERDAPTTVALFVACYSIVHIVMGFIYGPGWHEKADTFGNFSDFFARLSPWMRRKDNTLVLTNPFHNLAALPVERGTFAVVTVLLGTTAFDGFGRTQMWNRWTGDIGDEALILLSTVGLLAAYLIVAGTFSLAVGVSSKTKGVTGDFAHSVIPIAAGYFIAHYFSLLLFQGQAGYLLLFAPGSGINYSFVSASVIASTQVLAIVAGHVIGVLSAHDRALTKFEGNQVRSQFPLMTVMVCYTFAGIGLLLSA